MQDKKLYSASWSQEYANWTVLDPVEVVLECMELLGEFEDAKPVLDRIMAL